MGGKSRIARQIAEFINEIPRRKVTDCQTPCPDNHACGGGGRTALSAYFAAVVPLRARCRAFPARYSMTATNTSLPCSRASKTDMSCRSVLPRRNTATYGTTKTMTPLWLVSWALGAALAANGLGAMPETPPAPTTPCKASAHSSRIWPLCRTPALYARTTAGSGHLCRPSLQQHNGVQRGAV